MNLARITQLNALGLLGLSAVLLIAYVMQLSLNELPCPLCLLQRVGFAMVMFGLMLNVVYGPQQRHYGIVLFGALFGAAAALRQVSLHVIPGTPGYGSPIFGMHYYTWAFVLFAVAIIAVAVLLVLWRQEWNSEEFEMTTFGRFTCLLAISVVALNVISTFIECGPFQCPDNPVSYWLIDSMS